MKSFEEHEADIEKYIGMKKSASVWRKLACAYYGIGRPEKAGECFDEVLKLKPSRNAWFNRGYVYFILEDARAKECYREALKLDSKFKEAWNNLGCAYEKEDSLRALKCFENALKIDKDYSAALNNKKLLLSKGLEVSPMED